MDEQQYKIWWQLHRRTAIGEPLSDEEERAYHVGLAQMEAEEWTERRPVTELLRPLQEQWQELKARQQQLAQEEAALRAQAAELERNYRALTGEPLGLVI